MIVETTRDDGHTDGSSHEPWQHFFVPADLRDMTLSILICGWIGAAAGWHAAFAWGAVGPIMAALLVNLGMPRGRTRAPGTPAPALLDFRPVLRNRRTLPYILGYSAHNYELFGQRSWMVAFLVFTASLQPADAPMLIAATTLAAAINMLGSPPNMATGTRSRRMS